MSPVSTKLPRPLFYIWAVQLSFVLPIGAVVAGWCFDLDRFRSETVTFFTCGGFALLGSSSAILGVMGLQGISKFRHYILLWFSLPGIFMSFGLAGYSFYLLFLLIFARC